MNAKKRGRPPTTGATLAEREERRNELARKRASARRLWLLLDGRCIDCMETNTTDADRCPKCAEIHRRRNRKCS